MSKVLITGGAGFIGSQIGDRLLAEGHELIVLDDFSSGHRHHLAQQAGQVHLIEDTVLNIGAHRAALQGVTRIYHMAALISGQDSLYEPEAYLNTNLIGLARLIDVARELPGVRIMFASTSGVYGNNPAPLRSENTPAAPLTTYALTKYAGEHMLAMYAGLYGFDYVCLRLFNVYGPRQSPNHPYANVTCKFAHAAACGGSVKLYGDGTQSRDFVFVDDVVRAFLLVSEGSQERIYNVGTGRDASIASLLDEVQHLAGTQLEVEQCPPWPNDIQAIRADISRLEHEFAFAPAVSLSAGLSRTIEYFRARN